MKLSVFTVVVPDLTPEELAAEAKKAGLHGIEWRFKGVPPEARNEAPSFWGNNLCSIDPEASDEELDRFARITREQGLECAALTPYLNVRNLEATERALYAAQRIGANTVRIGAAHYDRTRPYPELYDLQMRYMEQVEPLCRKYGVKGLLETHHQTIACSASLAHRIVSSFDPTHIGVLYDPGNLVHEGYENHRLGLELLGPYLAHVHVKNAGWKEAERREDGSMRWHVPWLTMEDGIVDWKQMITDLQSVGYDGYLGVEDFSKAYSSRELLARFVQWAQQVNAV